ncbi:MAG: class III poly(R)-hydroxyalkanoic acid synthase subunit PhaE [Chromatiaceae bacterium]|nr:class III poly(R)-hydroxyalkanoic acid synthase subunit PhaE [Chromatiaceae bacterium]MCW5586426.1 class III poly(R)-hydroxyalkanoic acid synthase subunit PhaE [Chromatiales bacterium]HOP17796.1 class III poly(R)-hydroxyalkanoic acid synthase subunit PhaE [Gammaproteobacteria bacterium]MCP5434621.1 class III poly(R)-hydroxyalkanoic acid synthase subunit PhaE [Chromatiaceae bacterium]MCP5437968.1 class III poly(R)-hydroxyalkanoic acid synthase subunit PhaE [Chromatiaceae bacterium]
MSTNSNNWNETLMNDWVATQRKYWDTWSDFARKSGVGGAQGPAANPFGAFGSFTANPFAQNPFMQNPFAQNPMGGNPFGGAANPFTGMVEQWWSSVKPQAQGDIGGVAQRFYDMGKSFMSMAEGMFGASGQEQPDAAMQMWMSSMQAALQQWIAQVQNNMDLATPDLPGVSGTTLNTWAQLADTLAPWLNMSQDYLKDIAAGHLPGGIEMPGLGAAQEQFCRALSVPGLGYTREQQEHIQQLARHLLTYHEAFRAYKVAFGKTALASLESVQKRLQDMHAAGQKIESLRALYDMWVDASEEAYGEFVMSDEYQVVYGDLVNSLMRVRKDMNELAEQHYQLMNIPTRSEIDTVQRRQQEQRRENRHLRREIAEMRAQIEQLAKARPEAARPRQQQAKAPAQDRLPIDDVAEDLTAIKGIGPKMAEKLYDQGIKNYAQLAAMNTKFAEQLDEALKAQGRILRDDWIGQAKKLLG